MNYASRRMMVWLGLLVVSTVVHAIVSWRVGKQIAMVIVRPFQ